MGLSRAHLSYVHARCVWIARYTCVHADLEWGCILGIISPALLLSTNHTNLLSLIIKARIICMIHSLYKCTIMYTHIQHTHSHAHAHAHTHTRIHTCKLLVYQIIGQDAKKTITSSRIQVASMIGALPSGKNSIQSVQHSCKVFPSRKSMDIYSNCIHIHSISYQGQNILLAFVQ